MNHECKWCGGDLGNKLLGTNCNTVRYCSEKCKIAAGSELRRQRVKIGYVPPEYDKTCKECGAEFKTKFKDKVYCSPACKSTHYERHRVYAEPAQRPVLGPDDWSVTTPYGSHEFDPLVANWLRSAPIIGSTLIGVNHG